MKAFHADRAVERAREEETATTGRDHAGRGRGRPKGTSGGAARKNGGTMVGDRFVAVAALLRGETTNTAGDAMHLASSSREIAGEIFSRCSVALAEAFLNAGLDAAAAERNGDSETANRTACPANLVPTPHVPKLASA
jgi:hypothetical protein